jgi:UDP-glucose 4-epimerase
MRVLVTGSSGHLGEGLMRELYRRDHECVGLDLLPSPFTDHVGSVADRDLVRRALRGVDAVLHAATLHKPHVGSHGKAEFVETNVSGTLALLEEADAAGVGAFVFTSSTSAFGRALTPAAGTPAAWIDEDVVPRVRNVYGATKLAGEDLCELAHRESGLPCLVLRTARFFPEADDDATARATFADENLKLNELLHRRLDLDDAVGAHMAALERAPEVGFGRFVVSATTPFGRSDAGELATDAAGLVRRLFPTAEALYAERGWRLPETITRVYDNRRARSRLGWEPRLDFGAALGLLAAGEEWRGPLALAVGAKGYHAEPTGVYTLHPPGSGEGDELRDRSHREENR